jgi:hypothetical protein
VPNKGKGDIVMNNSRCVVIVARHRSTGLNMPVPAPLGVTIQWEHQLSPTLSLGFRAAA